MIELVAELTRNLGIVEEVVRASAANAARPVQPILIDVLTERKLRSSPLLRAHSHGQFRQNAVKTREIEAI